MTRANDIILEARGFTPKLRNGGKHLKITWHDGNRAYTVVISRSPSSRQAIHRACATLQRILRDKGLPSFRKTAFIFAPDHTRNKEYQGYPPELGTERNAQHAAPDKGVFGHHRAPDPRDTSGPGAFRRHRTVRHHLRRVRLSRLLQDQAHRCRGCDQDQARSGLREVSRAYRQARCCPSGRYTIVPAL
jgi:hypothetical protein